MSSLDVWARGWVRGSHLGKTARGWSRDGHGRQTLARVGSVLSLEHIKRTARGPHLIRFFFDQQDNADQNSSEDLCYTLISHSVLGRKPSGISAERCYENVSPKTEKPRNYLRETETSYALLRVHSSPSNLSSPEDEYELT